MAQMVLASSLVLNFRDVGLLTFLNMKRSVLWTPSL